MQPGFCSRDKGRTPYPMDLRNPPFLRIFVPTGLRYQGDSPRPDLLDYLDFRIAFFHFLNVQELTPVSPLPAFGGIFDFQRGGKRESSNAGGMGGLGGLGVVVF